MPLQKSSIAKSFCKTFPPPKIGSIGAGTCTILCKSAPTILQSTNDINSLNSRVCTCDKLIICIATTTSWSELGVGEKYTHTDEEAAVRDHCFAYIAKDSQHLRSRPVIEDKTKLYGKICVQDRRSKVRVLPT